MGVRNSHYLEIMGVMMTEVYAPGSRFISKDGGVYWQGEREVYQQEAMKRPQTENESGV